MIIKTVDKLLGNPEGAFDFLIIYAINHAGHDLFYATDSKISTGIFVVVRERN